MLPSRRELAREYRVSSVTIGRAIDSLISDDLLRADSRRGTFVSSHPQVLSSSAPSNGGAARSADFTVGALPRPTPPVPVRRGGRIGIVAAYGAAPFSQDALILHAMEQALSENGQVTAVCNRA